MPVTYQNSGSLVNFFVGGDLKSSKKYTKHIDIKYKISITDRLYGFTVIVLNFSQYNIHTNGNMIIAELMMVLIKRDFNTL